MITTVTASRDPELTWQQKSLQELEQAFGQPFNFWGRRKETGWVLQNAAQNTDTTAKPCRENNQESQLSGMLDQATLAGSPQSVEQSPGRYLLIIPFGHDAAATTSIETDNLELLLRMAKIGERLFRQQEELLRLHEENEFFLKQVSDDFEELTFLRSMAERLGLGDETHTLEQLVVATLPELGKSTHSESLHFVDAAEKEMQVLASWHDGEVSPLLEEGEQILRLVSLFCNSDECRAIIKNGFEFTDQGQDFSGIRDFIVIPVGKTGPPLGWFVAINRQLEGQVGTDVLPEWRLNQHEFGTSEASLLSTAAAMTASHAKNLSLFHEREQLLVNVVRTLVSAVEAKDQYTCGHSERVALFAKRLSEQVGYSEEQSELLYLTGLLHDIGKIAISDAVLNKPGQLTDEEYAEIQRHPEEGWKILQDLKQLNYVLPGVLHHHERMDGKGYPDGLQGVEIPLDGRVLAVADAYDAMTSDRAYRSGMPHEKAVNILREGAGTQWDTDAVHAFLAIEDEITEIRNTYLPRVRTNRQPTTVSTFTKLKHQY